MMSTKATFVTGTAEVKRREMSQDTFNLMLPERQLVSDQHSPGPGTDVDGKCTCCPYGYHIDLDFLNFCQDLEAGSTLKNLWRIQRTKRKLRKSMELMLSAEEVILTDPSSAQLDVANSSEAERLLHMVNYEQRASHQILRQIDSDVGAATARIESGEVWRNVSSDSDETQRANITSRVAGDTQDQSGLKTTRGSGLNHADSLSSMSSASTTSNELPAVYQTENVQKEERFSVNNRTTSKIVANPVLEMATAEMKHYSTTSSAELANTGENHIYTALENPVLEMATAEMKHYSAVSSAELVEIRENHPYTVLKNPVLEMATAEMKPYSAVSSAELVESRENHPYTALKNPVLEMATAEMKHYSTVSSAELADSGGDESKTSIHSIVMEATTEDMRHYSLTSSAHLVDSEGTKLEVMHTQPTTATRVSAVKIPRSSADENEASIQLMKETMNTSLQRIKVLEDQVKTIPILQVRISVLKEEKRLLNLQLKAVRTNTRPQTMPVGGGRVNVTEEKGHFDLSSRIFQLSISTDDDMIQLPRSLVEKVPQLTSPKSVRTSSLGVGDHSVLEPYKLQPDLPTGYTVQENETCFEIYSRKSLEDEIVTANRTLKQQLITSFQHASSHDSTYNRDQLASTTLRESATSTPPQDTSDSSQLKSSVCEIQKISPKALTRTIGTGDGNVFEDSKLQVHEKELRTVIIGQSGQPAKRNVGIECRPATRDVGVLFVCEEEKPETRTVGVNVSYDISQVVTSLDFKGETQLRLALQDVLHKNVRSVGTNCIMKQATSEIATMTIAEPGVSVGCGDEEHRVDVEVRPTVARKSAAVTAKPDLGHKCISTEADWVVDAYTNTVKANCYHKSVMTDKQQQVFVSTNTEPVPTRPASNQTEQKVFISIDQVRHAGSNTEDVTTSCKGMSTDIITTQNAYVNTEERASDIITTQNAYVNTEERISDLFHGSFTHKNISSMDVQSLQRTIETDAKNGDLRLLSDSKEILGTIPSRTSDVALEEQVIHEKSAYDNSVLGRSEYTKKSSRFDSGNTHYSSLEISTRSSPLSQSRASSQEGKMLTHKHFDKTNSALEKVTPATGDEGFSETVVEHYVITKDGKKLVSEEKITTSSLGTNRSFKEYSDEIHQTAQPEISSSQRSYNECNTKQDAGSNSWMNIRSSGNYGTTTGHDSMVADNSCISEVNNTHKKEDNMADDSPCLPSATVNSGSGIYQVSQQISEEQTESRQKTSSKTRKVTSGGIFYDIRRTGSVEDFMPGEMRKYMSLDASTSKNSNVHDATAQIVSGESSGASRFLEAITPYDAGESKSFNVLETGSTESNRTEAEMVLQDIKTYEESGVLGRTMTSESVDGENRTAESSSSSEQHGQDVVDSSSFSGATSSSVILQGQGHSCSGRDSGVVVDAALTDSSFIGSDTRSSHEAVKATVGVREEVSSLSVETSSSSVEVSSSSVEVSSSSVEVSSSPVEVSSSLVGISSSPVEVGQVVPLKSIMKHRTEAQCSSSKKAITFDVTVTGGTDSSSEEDNSCSDTESSEKCPRDHHSSDVTDFCTYDETVTRGLPEGQMLDQNIREIYELSNELKNACTILATYLTDSTSIQTKQLNASQDIIKKEWFQLSSHKLSSALQVEDFLTFVKSTSRRLLEYIVNLTDENGNTAIHYCISHCNFEIAGQLLESEVCDVNKRNKAGYTPIMLAGLASVHNQQDFDVITRLLSLGDINARATPTQQTALMLAASHDRTELAKLLVEGGADVNLQDQDGSTALMCACEHGHLEIVSFLLTQPSIDVNITDNENSTALNIAMETDHKDIGVILYKHLNFSKVSSPGSPKKRKSSSSPTQSNV